jgi:hypothetical protein
MFSTETKSIATLIQSVGLRTYHGGQKCTLPPKKRKAIYLVSAAGRDKHGFPDPQVDMIAGNAVPLPEPT